MEMTLIYIVLVILCLSVALNLKLTLKLNAKIGFLSSNDNSLSSIAIGEKIPLLTGKTFFNKQWTHLQNVEQSSVLIFLSSDCPQCKEKISEIEAIVPLLPDEGLTLKLISHESKRRIKHFFGDSPLLNDVVITSKKQYKALNPRDSSPFYLFVDHAYQLQAVGFIGDEDWLSFIDQIINIEKVS